MLEKGATDLYVWYNGEEFSNIVLAFINKSLYTIYSKDFYFQVVFYTKYFWLSHFGDAVSTLYNQQL